MEARVRPFVVGIVAVWTKDEVSMVETVFHGELKSSGFRGKV